MSSSKVRHLVCKSGRFYWQPSAELRAKGWTPERLPDDLLAAQMRAEVLNTHVDEVRAGKHAGPARPRPKVPPRPQGRRPASGTSGVYVVGAGAGEPVKVGIATDVAGRLVQLQTGSPRMLRILLYRTAEFGDAVQVERLTHEEFAAARVAGEWFRADPEVVIEFVLQTFARMRLSEIRTPP